MMEIVQQWRAKNNSDIVISLELEKPAKHPLAYAELCDVLFLSQVYAEEQLEAGDMMQAVVKARDSIENKK